MYKLAYDILVLQGKDEELGEIIKSTVTRIAQGILDNDYYFVDAWGYTTSWGKYNPDYLTNGYAWEDAALINMVLLTILKTTAYITQDMKWEEEYRKVALGEGYKYADLLTEFRERWNLLLVNNLDNNSDNAPDVNGFGEPLADVDIARRAPGGDVWKWVQRALNHSDEEQALLAYYTLFQLEKDPVILAKLRQGLEDWWISGKMQSSHAWWMYVYQLAYPDKKITDTATGDLLKDAAWALKRHPLDTRTWLIRGQYRVNTDGFELLYGSRNLVSLYDPENKTMVALPWDERDVTKFNTSPFSVSREGNPEGTMLRSSTTYTLPYWMGIYHGMLKDTEM